MVTTRNKMHDYTVVYVQQFWRYKMRYEGRDLILATINVNTFLFS